MRLFDREKWSLVYYLVWRSETNEQLFRSKCTLPEYFFGIFVCINVCIRTCINQGVVVFVCVFFSVQWELFTKYSNLVVRRPWLSGINLGLLLLNSEFFVNLFNKSNKHKHLLHSFYILSNFFTFTMLSF